MSKGSSKVASKVKVGKSTGSFATRDFLGGQPIVAKGPEAERLAKQYHETLMRHSRLNPDNTPSLWSRAALLIFIIILFWYAIRGRVRVIQWKRMLYALNGEPWDKDYTNMDQLAPMDDRIISPRHAEI